MKNVKGIIFLLIMTILCSGMTAYAANPINVYIDGAILTADVPPINIDGRVLVPLRAISEALNATVEWNAAEQMVTVFNGDKACVLTIDNNNVVVIDIDETTVIQLDVPPTIKGDRTLLPIRFFAEFFGCNVDWQSTDSEDMVIITQN